MNSFLDRMDDIWEHEFQEAWNSIHPSDYEAERALNETVNKYFREDLAIFAALVNKKVRGDALKDRCTIALTHSKTLAAEAWRIAAQSKIKKAQEEARDLPPKQNATGSRTFRISRLRSKEGNSKARCRRRAYEGIQDRDRFGYSSILRLYAARYDEWMLLR